MGVIDAARYAETPFGCARRTSGAHGYIAYFPRPIPRTVEISSENLLRLADAEAALGRLAGAGRLLAHPHLLVRPYLRREAVASTRIEGTQASLLDVFNAEASGQPLSWASQNVERTRWRVHPGAVSRRSPGAFSKTPSFDISGIPRRMAVAAIQRSAS